MIGPSGKTNSSPIRLLIDYWQTQPSRMGERLDDLLRRGVKEVATFVPWQAVESDISHTLDRFLQAVLERDLKVSLILSPEVGVHYPNSGVPRDLVDGEGAVAKDSQARPFCTAAAPNYFQLPSLVAPEFAKRFQNYLVRMESLLARLARSAPHASRQVSVVLTGSFWKYYRNSVQATQDPFGGTAGDYSGSAEILFLKRLQEFYARDEFERPNAAAANRWKTRDRERLNRRWFYQNEEDLFRQRSHQQMIRRGLPLEVEDLELFAPEVDPAYTMTALLQMASGGRADFYRLSEIVEECSTRESFVSGDKAAPFMHWTATGPFRTLADSEKQFLLLKSLLLMGGRGGGILIDEKEWFALSHSFRSRAETLSRAIADGELKLKNRALYLAPHLWSRSGTLFNEMRSAIGSGARFVSSWASVRRDREARVVIIDPSVIVTKSVVEELRKMAESGRVVCLARSPLYTEAATDALEELSRENSVRMDLDVAYRVHSMGLGKFVVFDLPEDLNLAGESSVAWRTFVRSILSLGEIESYCRLSDSRLSVIPMARDGGRLALFVMNGAGRSVSAKILFSKDVEIGDLTSDILDPRSKALAKPAKHFELDVPPCGILPMSVLGLDESLDYEGIRESADAVMEHTEVAAQTLLPGFERLEPGEGEERESPWS